MRLQEGSVLEETGEGNLRERTNGPYLRQSRLWDSSLAQKCVHERIETTYGYRTGVIVRKTCGSCTRRCLTFLSKVRPDGKRRHYMHSLLIVCTNFILDKDDKVKLTYSTINNIKSDIYLRLARFYHFIHEWVGHGCGLSWKTTIYSRIPKIKKVFFFFYGLWTLLAVIVWMFFSEFW